MRTGGLMNKGHCWTQALNINTKIEQYKNGGGALKLG